MVTLEPGGGRGHDRWPRGRPGHGRRAARGDGGAAPPWLAVRAHLLELRGDSDRAQATFILAARAATNQAEQQYLTLKAAHLASLAT